MTQHDVTDRLPVHALLADGTTVCIRPVRPGDHEQIQGLYEEMSPENLRLRFFSPYRGSARLSADRVCGPVGPGCRALLAETQGRVVGVWPNPCTRANSVPSASTCAATSRSGPRSATSGPGLPGS
ncbi:hypothetical protein SALBM217S_06785 [Streptomyces griseoloalbus]